MNDIMKIVQAIEDSNILLKRDTTTIKNGKKRKKIWFSINAARHSRT